jgi:hypothetical protein
MVIVIPNAMLLEREPFQYQEPYSFWQLAYWDSVQGGAALPGEPPHEEGHTS